MSRQEPPFVRKKVDVNESLVSGPDLYEGYCIDLLVELARIHGFKYELYLSPDGTWGAPLENGSKNQTWSGLMGELLSHVRIRRTLF